MAKMTMDYNANIKSEIIINWLCARGVDYDIFPNNADDSYGNEYHGLNHNIQIMVKDNKQVQISDSDGKLRNIKKTKSKLLKMVKGLELN